MILTGSAIQTAVRKGLITLEPFLATNINPNSYNYHLSDTLLVHTPDGRRWRKKSIPETGLVLNPGQVYLASTLEEIGSSRYVMLLLGRSSIGRLGIFLNITADLGHVGSCSHWTLELTVIQPVRIYPRMCIGQVSFWHVASSRTIAYDGRYSNDVGAVANRDARLRTFKS